MIPLRPGWLDPGPTAVIQPAAAKCSADGAVKVLLSVSLEWVLPNGPVDLAAGGKGDGLWDVGFLLRPEITPQSK
jgi:hypothetical protein